MTTTMTTRVTTNTLTPIIFNFEGPNFFWSPREGFRLMTLIKVTTRAMTTRVATMIT